MLNLVGPSLVPVAEDLSAAIVAAVLCASLLLTAGILQQGAQPSMFQDGLIFFRPVCHVAADHIMDAATNDAGVAEIPPASSAPPGSIGAQFVLASRLPTLTLLLTVVVVVGAVVVASTATT
ncbi:hypothetical protein SPRG_17846 [Saprolegnia parasitica CBS 223.65]|uniref:Uncharacterized protein n=1 Tax=Saprolegnia parasitica (strain CBS 223.65) TaxID=695850 RepID=A0A067BEX9_SAPPC|nr:hypothetical protein SPRG_17846 [Saprolegnia parasitica CBS 223.65]KDO16658.1 hypothetical protein SPRG_17846 [Saprolegnia parasitica CBS 223.65]|eukprot:XP_012212634.1 hypothetical protein SPRG_17846 [Saprolegnia parasitica CBS 223.65]